LATLYLHYRCNPKCLFFYVILYRNVLQALYLDANETAATISFIVISVTFSYNTLMVTREAVLSLFMQKPVRLLGHREIVYSMGISRSETRALKRILEGLTRDGVLIITRGGLYGPAEEMDLIPGYFEAHRDGYGFVVLEKPAERDLFIPSRWTLGAMDNDRVIAKMVHRGRHEGRIVKILDRATTKIAGRFDMTKAASFVRPANRSVPFDLYISPRDRGNANQGNRVIAEILSFPADNKPARGRVLKVIVRPENPQAEVEAIIEELNLPRRFSKAVHDEAKNLFGQVPYISARGEGAGLPANKRKDLRDLTTVTIDGERARDFDDAVSIKLTEHGYRLWVHIADVGFFVAWNSRIDEEARRRGTSIYFPDRVLPMLPKELSEDLCCLRPKEERPALTVEIDFNREGERTNARFYPSLIVSDERMTYTSVKKILLDHDAAEREKYGFLLRDLELMNELCGILRTRRLGRGSLDFDLPEPEVLLDLQGRPEAIIRAERNLAHMIIEEFMIAANETVAMHIGSLGVPCIYRIHEEPDPLKMERIMTFVRQAAGLQKGKLKGAGLHRVLAEIEGKPGEDVIQSMVIRSLKQARYSTANAGHFGLASDCYTHFTSPIRRYPDLVVHRILREVITKRRITKKRASELGTLLPEIAFHASRMERLADEAEHEAVDAMRVWFMKDKIGEVHDGEVVGVTPRGLQVRLRDFYVEGFIPASCLKDDLYCYHKRTLTLKGRRKGRTFNPGKELKLRIDGVDRDEREVLLSVV
jgi:ribonuclease R